MLITKKNDTNQNIYLQVFDINYLNLLRIPLPMTLYLKWITARKEEYKFIMIEQNEKNFIRENYNLLFDFDAYNSDPNKYFSLKIGNTSIQNYRQIYYLKNIKYITEHNYSNEKKAMIKGLK